jgi:hypothetical protein
LKFGAAEAAVQDIHVVIVVHFQLEAQAETMQFKQLIPIQDVNIVFVQAEVGHVVNHIRVQRAWVVNPMLTVTT